MNTLVCSEQTRYEPFIALSIENVALPFSGNTKGGSITVPLTPCLTGLDLSVLQMKTKIVSCHTADSKLLKQEINGIVILPRLVFPAFLFAAIYSQLKCKIRLFQTMTIQRLLFQDIHLTFCDAISFMCNTI